MRIFSVAFFILLICNSAALCVSVKKDNTEDPLQEVSENDIIITDIYSESVKGMMQSSSLVVHATVSSVSPIEEKIITEEPEERRGGIRKTNTVIHKVAALDVIHIYKGTYSGDTLTVRFRSPSVKESPAPVEFSEHEEIIVFLGPSQSPPHYSTVSQTTGKMNFSYELDDKLKELSEADRPIDAPSQGKIIPRSTDNTTAAGNLTLNLTAPVKTASVGEPLFVTILLMNNSNMPVRVDTVLDPAKILKVADSASAPVPVRSSHIILTPDIRPLPPQHFTGARYNIVEIFQIDSPGVYIIRGSLWPVTSGEPEMLISSPITFTITE